MSKRWWKDLLYYVRVWEITKAFCVCAYRLILLKASLHKPYISMRKDSDAKEGALMPSNTISKNIASNKNKLPWPNFEPLIKGQMMEDISALRYVRPARSQFCDKKNCKSRHMIQCSLQGSNLRPQVYSIIRSIILIVWDLRSNQLSQGSSLLGVVVYKIYQARSSRCLSHLALSTS